MTPAAWRKREGLTLRELAARLGCTRMSAMRYESGEREAPNSIALTYERISGGEVTAEDLNRARGRYLHSKAA
jgi:transcriptional regulator with XRE-family HTH domain